MTRRLLRSVPAVAVVAAVAALAAPVAAQTVTTASLVSVATPSASTPENHQNEPALAVDAHQPNVLVAGWNEWGDAMPCPQQTATQAGTCFAGPAGIGLSGVGFSFDSGRSWVQPTYTGWTGRNCPPDPSCAGQFGPIVTLPWYYESGLSSSGDPAVAVGPRPGPNGFSWANGSRVYYANLVENFNPAFPSHGVVRGFTGIGVSRLDNPTPSRVTDKNSWMRPVIANTHASQTAFEDKEQIWADNASSSPYFGRTYVCSAQFRSVGKHLPANFPAPIMVSVSPDGGTTWTTKQITPAGTTGRGPTEWGISGCTIRTTSTGVVYLFGEMFQNPALVGLPTHGAHVMFASYDGGMHWTKPTVLWRVTDPCFFVDPVEGRCVMDGYAGARTDLSAAPSVDIANGAPTGASATNEIVDAWADASAGLNNEHAMVAWYANGGWHGPSAVSLPGDRPMYAAPAISPAGDSMYVVYEAVTSPWRGADMTSPRPYHGVLRSAAVTDGAPGGWATNYVGPFGDLRGTYPGHDIYQERIGDYVYAVATRTYGAAVWTDARSAEVCPAVQQYRANSLAAGTLALPAPWPLFQCPMFGNTDIWAVTTG
ncbi:MAG: hypothetical protein QOI76_3792 [Frankiales bacterium]|nr:hypothetical protein [Frankiales bacterium]